MSENYQNDELELENSDDLQETAASDSIKMKGDASKVNIMAQIASMGKDDINKLSEVLSQFGPNKDYGVGDNSAKNAATIAMKPSAATGAAVKEDLEIAFEGEDLSEDFKSKATNLFEAAISARVGMEVARLEEEAEEQINEQVEALTEELTNKLNSYMDYVVEQWMTENEVAIESTLQTEINKDFMEGLRNLFQEHYIDIPTEQVDVVESLAEKVEELESMLDESISNNDELRSIIIENTISEIQQEVASGMALTQQEKFLQIAEDIEFEGDFEVYAEKLLSIKESYFSETSNQDSNIMEESYEGEELNEAVESPFKGQDPAVRRYAEAMTKSFK
jgi:hypothetical protein